MSTVVGGVDGGTADGLGSGPLAPLDTPLAWALLAAARRQGSSPVGAGAHASLVTASQAVTAGGLTVDPSVAFADGIFYGSLNAVSAGGNTLTYTSLGGANGGKLTLGTGPVDPTAQDFTALPYATWLDSGPKGTEQFSVRVSEVTKFDQFLINIPLVGMLAKPVIGLLQQLPLISSLLAPLIGSSVVAAIDVNVGTLAPGDTPVAYTYDVTSFDGVKISTNFFPSSGLQAVGDFVEAPAVINPPGLASPGQTNPYAEWGITNQTVGVGTLRTNGYNVVTYDPRGEFASGGVLQLDNPFFEGRDVSAVVDFIAANTATALDGLGDPVVGMVGGSYGGGIQLTAASTDPRIDVIVPDIAWNSLISSLYPSGSFRSAYASLLLLSLITTNARINPQIYAGIWTGDNFNWLSDRSQAVLASSGPTALLNQLQAPTMFTQGTVDVLFPLQQSLDNLQSLVGPDAINPFLTREDVRLTWFCGGHGYCADPVNPTQALLLKNNALAWLSKYLKADGAAADAIPLFQWYDQLGNYQISDKLPFDEDFNDLPNILGSSTGGVLGIVPIIGGSGPGPEGVSLPYSLGNGTLARNAINVDLTVPLDTQVVGAPTVSFSYQGLGTSKAVFAQIVDKSTGRVLGNAVTPVPVVLDGRTREVSINLADIAYTYGGETNPGQLMLQITSSATAFGNGSIGVINISDINVALPNRNGVLD